MVMWVAGIGPPLEQLEKDYRRDRLLADTRMAKDVLALIAEVRRLRRDKEREV